MEISVLKSMLCEIPALDFGFSFVNDKIEHDAMLFNSKILWVFNEQEAMVLPLPN